jgi:D-cysteine desulfhydrase family pyridoxal phosphate-dependent enzyme
MIPDLDHLPRARITFLPTPLVEMRRLSAVLGGPRLLVKRDDLTGLGMGGNKTRKLEFLLGEALRQGCDAVITGGAIQSNHCRQTAAACAVVGLECHLALGGELPAVPEGNLLLDRLFGATVHRCDRDRIVEHIAHVAEALRARGRNPYVIPFGGSNAVGAMGFVAAVAELKEQCLAQQIHIDALVLPSGSGGTQAGVAAGVALYDPSIRVIGIAIDRAAPGDPPYESELAVLANQVAARLDAGPRVAARFTASDFEVRYEYAAPGYEVVTDVEREALQLAGRYEGLLLDPVYTGRAMGATIDMIRRGEFAPDETVLFWHTGGTPALFGYAGELYPA